MALSDERKLLRIYSLQYAASMIEEAHEGGMTPEDLGMTEDQLEIFIEENKRTAKRLYKEARKLAERYGLDISSS